MENKTIEQLSKEIEDLKTLIYKIKLDNCKDIKEIREFIRILGNYYDK